MIGVCALALEVGRGGKIPVRKPAESCGPGAERKSRWTL